MAQEGSRTADTRRGIYECNSQGCICCKHILKGFDQFQSAATGNQYEITQYLTCKIPSVIYIIQCKECKVQYVGKTSTALHKRFTDHRSSIRKCRHRPIPDHFTKNGHCLDDLIVYPIEQVTGSKELSDRELHWIRELDTVENGLNLGPYECVRQQTQDDGDKRPVEPTEGQVEAPQKGKRKLCGNEDVKSKKMKINRQSVFSYETEQLLLTVNDAFEDGKEAISMLEYKLKDVSSRGEKTMSFLEDLKEKISGLKENNWKETIHIGLFGKTGAGKSSLINAIVQENELLPSSGDSEACTSTFVHVQANTESSKYKADIELISTEDWKSELHFLLELLENENDQQNTEKTDEDEEMVKMAKEKIKAIYGEEGLQKNYHELVGAKEFPVILGTGMKPLTFDTAKELSEGIECYIRSDTDEQFWPLVKRVTISLPKSPALLEGIVLVDLPGAGDVSKYRSDMWKECLSQCSSVWIVNEMNRVLSEKVADEIFDTSLRTIAGGGECHNITFICTKTDVIKPKEIKKKYRITDEDLKIDIKDAPEYEKKEKQACILYRNKKLKEKISEIFKDKTKKFLLGDENHSTEFFDVYTVSCDEFKERAVLDDIQTELPALIEHIKKLYVSHFEKKVKDYVSEVSGIISYFHFSKDALSSKEQSSNDKEFDRLEKDLGETCRTLNKNLSQVHQKLLKELEMGAKTAETTCLKNATDRVLESRGSDNRGHHRTLKALCRNDGYYRSRKGVLVDLNYTLSQPMYKKINEKSLFLTTFGTGSTRASIKGTFESFQENFIKHEHLKQHKTKNKETYLRLVYIRTEQRKVLKKLEKEILQRKKLIYNSLSDSIRDTMKQTYQECSDIKGKESFRKIQGKLKTAIEDFKKTMFHNAMTKMLEEFSDLEKYLVDQIKTQMTTALRLGLSQIAEDLTGLPDVSEETAMMKRCCESLGLQVF